MSRVLILSVHVKCKDNYWKSLQPQFVAENTADYEYGIIVNGDDPSGYKNVVSSIPQSSHSRGIEEALRIFRQRRNLFDAFLLLDSDCFPIRQNWQRVLDGMLGKQYQYAAPIRAENFDVFPHPCAFYMKRAFLDKADFGFSKAPNLLGIPVADVGSAMPERGLWYPLVKTNYISPHPVYGSIYGDLFYHHCAGSRGIGFRANTFGAYDHVISKTEHRKIYSALTSQLVRSPRRLINRLRGVGLRVENKAAEQ